MIWAHEAKKPGLLQALAFEMIGADETNRTSDLLITNQLLYQLSYISDARYFSKKGVSIGVFQLALCKNTVRDARRWRLSN